VKRVLVALAAGGFAIVGLSFFIPPGFHNAPLGRLLWAFERVATSEPVGLSDRCIFLGVSVVIVYPYLYSLLAAFTVSVPSGRALFPLHLGLHGVGLGLLFVFGLLLLLSGDTYVPRAVQVGAMLFALLFGSFAAVVAKRLRARRASLAVMTATSAVQVPLQLGIAAAVFADGGPPGGYLLGACGALLAFCGSVSLFMVEGARSADLRDRSDV